MENNIKNLIKNGEVKVDNEVIIGTTKKYELFNLLDCNREINKNNVENIKKSINKAGYCKSNEVIVDEFWNIIDGQHTFTACEELGIDIRFKMIPNIDVDTIMTLNTNQRNWTNVDFVKSYASRGFKDYQVLLDILEENKDISLSYIIVLMFNSRGEKIENALKQGHMVITGEMLDRFNIRLKNYRMLLLDYKDRFFKKYLDDIKTVLELLDNDFMAKMLKHVFDKDEEFKIDLNSREKSQMELIADKIAKTFG